ncbi:MAG: hypothetical protein KDA54_14035 [Phycisphaerales bacterium]|nr:hypothetical protein [Phycisphaerales bacterium]
MDTRQCIEDIKAVHEHWESFWGDGGWASGDAAELLTASRLDWLHSLAGCLSLWTEHGGEDSSPGKLILAWANLGALLEGSLMFFLSVFKHNVDETNETVEGQRAAARLERWTLEQLRTFYEEHVWIEPERAELTDWILQVQRRRNAIHAYRDRELGTVREFRDDLIKYLKLIVNLEGRIPYPEEQYGYPILIERIRQRIA